MSILRKYISSFLTEKTKYKKEKQDFDTKQRIVQYADDPYAFVHFSDINKLGINPRSSFKTPLGIYGYPIKAFDIENLIKGNVPFAGDREFIHFFVVKPEHQDCVIFINQDGTTNKDEELEKIATEEEEKTGNFPPELTQQWSHLSNQIKQELNKYAHKNANEKLSPEEIIKVFTDNIFDRFFLIDKHLPKVKKIHELYNRIHNHLSIVEIIRDDILPFIKKLEMFEGSTLKQDFFELGKKIVKLYFDESNKHGYDDFDSPTKNAKIKTGVGKFWNMTRLATGDMKKWRSMLVNKFGLCGFVDYGSGLIHDSEPVQAVFFSKAYIDHVATIPNQNYKKESESQHNLIQYFNKRATTFKADGVNGGLLFLRTTITVPFSKEEDLDFPDKKITSQLKTISKNISYEMGTDEKDAKIYVSHSHGVSSGLYHVPIEIAIDLKSRGARKKIQYFMRYELDKREMSKKMKDLVKL